MRRMYDGITPSRIPHAGAELVAGYLDGMWPSFAEMVKLFPLARHVSIATSAATDAQVLDVETFDATPAQSVDWTLRQRAAGRIPTVYSNESTWPLIVQAFQRRRVLVPQWWSANYNGVERIAPGAIASQWQNTPGYDVSAVADHWPGVDPAFIPQLPALIKESPTVYMLRNKTTGDVELHLGNGQFAHVTTASYHSYKSAGIPEYDLPPEQFTALKVAITAAHG